MEQGGNVEGLQVVVQRKELSGPPTLFCEGREKEKVRYCKLELLGS